MSPPCLYCGHPLSDHCKGGIEHTSYKEDARMVPNEMRTGNHTCVSRHCKQPLCCCTDYLEPE